MLQNQYSQTKFFITQENAEDTKDSTVKADMEEGNCIIENVVIIYKLKLGAVL